MNRDLSRRDFLKATGGTLAGVSLLSISACGTDSNSGASNGGGNYEMMMGQYSNGTNPFWNKVISNFREQNQDTEVDFQAVGWDVLPQKLNTRITTGQPPNILGYNSYASYAADDLLLPAEEYTPTEVKNKFYENFYEVGSFEGTNYAIPLLASIRSLYYNKAIFETAGIERPPETWDELVQTAQTIKEEAGVPGFGVPMTEFEGQAYFSYFIWGNGGDWTRDGEWTLNSPENVEAIQFMSDLVNEQKVTNSDPTTINRDQLQRVFGAGEVGMMITANFLPTILDDEAPDLNWGVSSIPRAEGVEPFSMGVQDFMMVFNNTENLDAVRDFIAFVYDDSRYEEWMKQEGFIPATKPVGESMAGQSEEMAQYVESMPRAKFYPLQKPAYAQLRPEVVKACQRVLRGDSTAKKALDTLQQTAEGM